MPCKISILYIDWLINKFSTTVSLATQDFMMNTLELTINLHIKKEKQEICNTINMVLIIVFVYWFPYEEDTKSAEALASLFTLSPICPCDLEICLWNILDMTSGLDLDHWLEQLASN